MCFVCCQNAYELSRRCCRKNRSRRGTVICIYSNLRTSLESSYISEAQSFRWLWMDLWLNVLVNLCGWFGKTHNVWVDLIVFLRSRVSLGLCIISNVAELKFGARRDCCWCVGICKCVKFQIDENLQHFQSGRLFHVFGRPVEVGGWFICVGVLLCFALCVWI